MFHFHFLQVRFQRASEGWEDHQQREDRGGLAQHHLLLGEWRQVRHNTFYNHNWEISISIADLYFNQIARSVVLCSHLGRPDGLKNMKFTLAPVAEELRKLLNKVWVQQFSVQWQRIHQNVSAFRTWPSLLTVLDLMSRRLAKIPLRDLLSFLRTSGLCQWQFVENKTK